MNTIIETLKQKWAEYLIEIIVIISSILVAFALESWNSDRLAQKNEQELFKNIIEDLEEDYQTMSNLLQRVKLRQEIHLRLYNESVLEVNSDTGAPFSAAIVETTNIISITWDNHKNSIEKISDSRIRSRINQYFRNYQALLSYTETLNGAILNLLRPYMRRKEIINLRTVFESNPNQDDIDRFAFFQQDQLVAEFGTKDFNMLITELFLGTQDVIQSLETTLEGNQLLQSDLKKTID